MTLAFARADSPRKCEYPFPRNGGNPGSHPHASIRADVDDVRGEPDWTQAIVGIPAPKDHINIRIDHDVLQWFRSNGKGYQTLMNNVLRAFVQTRQQHQDAKSK